MPVLLLCVSLSLCNILISLGDVYLSQLFISANDISGQITTTLYRLPPISQLHPPTPCFLHRVCAHIPMTYRTPQANLCTAFGCCWLQGWDFWEIFKPNPAALQRGSGGSGWSTRSVVQPTGAAWGRYMVRVSWGRSQQELVERSIRRILSKLLLHK